MRGTKFLAVAALAGAQLLGMGSPNPAHARGNEGATVRGPAAPITERVAPISERVMPIPPGTTIPVTLDEDIPLKQDQVGQTFPGHVTRDVVVNGSVAVPEGAPAKVKLVPSSEKSDHATLQLAEVHVNGKTETVNSSDARAPSERSHQGLGKKTGIGAAAGAVVGAITGAGIVKGAIVGAGGGLAWGFFGGGKQIGKDTQVEFSTK